MVEEARGATKDDAASVGVETMRLLGRGAAEGSGMGVAVADGAGGVSGVVSEMLVAEDSSADDGGSNDGVATRQGNKKERPHDMTNNYQSTFKLGEIGKPMMWFK